MQKYEMAGMLVAIAMMAIAVGLCWPGKPVVATPRHAIMQR
jgi:hypothetical protein